MVSFEKPKLPKVLCIDEFKGNAQTGKYQCILVDGKHHKVIDILKDRTFAYLQSYFSSYTRQERKGVEYFVCDLWSPYAELARSMFPNAKLIADRYHFVRQVYWAVERSRKEKQKIMPKKQRKYFKRSKKLLLASYASLKEEDKRAVDVMLWYHEDLRKAHDLKIIRNKKKREQREQLDCFIKKAEKTEQKAFVRLASTYRKWRGSILNAFSFPYSNGVPEGSNNKIKVLKRISYGLKNFEEYRKRILLICN